MMTDKEAQAFMQKVDSSAQFWQELHDEDAPTMQIQGSTVPRCLYNLMVTKRDVNLYLHGLKPHRGWKIGDVKAYFGLKGDKQKVADAINAIHSELIGRLKEQDDAEQEQKTD